MNEYENADKKQQDIIDEINEKNKQEIDLEPVYSEEGAEDNIAPADLFEYEIINDGSVASSYMQSLPTKTAKITGIKPEYIDRQSIDYVWYYKIKYDGITDVLVIPYQAELDENGNVTENGEMYKITEVDLSIKGYKEWDYYYGSSFPSIEKVIYPNTVEKIGSSENLGDGHVLNQPSEIILSKNLISIGNYALYECSSLTNIEIPESVTSIGDYALSGITLTNIEIPKGVTSIGERAFYRCFSLTNIEIPESVTSIGDYAFQSSDELKEIVIPRSVKYIGRGAFYIWNSDLTIYFECSEDESKNWDTDWKKGCDANIVWNYNPDEEIE